MELKIIRGYDQEMPQSELTVCLFDLILYVPVNVFQLCRDRSSWIEPVLSKD